MKPTLVTRSILAAVLLPGSVTIGVPWLILDRTGSPLVHSLGLMLIALGAAVLVRCIRDFAVAGQGTLAPIDPPRHLLISGLYRHVRNPMYVGVVLILAGEAWAFASPAMAVYTVVFLVAADLFIRFHEEPALLRKFGASYEDYLREVPRWAFRIRPHRGA